MPLTSHITVSVGGDLTQTVGLVAAALAINGASDVQLANGTGASQADKIYHGQRTLTASATENLDLAGVLTDTFGAPITFVKIKAIYIKAAGNANNVVVGGAATNAFVGPFADASDKVSIPPNGVFCVSAPVNGWTVTAGTGDILLVANSGGGSSVTYDIVIIGTSA